MTDTRIPTGRAEEALRRCPLLSTPIGGDPLERPFAFFEWLIEAPVIDAAPLMLRGPDPDDQIDEDLMEATHALVEARTWAENDLPTIFDTFHLGGIDPDTSPYRPRIVAHLRRWLAYRRLIEWPADRIAADMRDMGINPDIEEPR